MIEETNLDGSDAPPVPKVSATREVFVYGSWYQELLSDSRDVVSRLLGERLQDVEALRAQVEQHHVHVRHDAGPLTDLDAAAALHEATLSLLDRTSDASVRVRRLAQVAVRYFVLQDDGDDDLHSPYGFDDDVEVFNAVVRAIGQPELEISA